MCRQHQTADGIISLGAVTHCGTTKMANRQGGIISLVPSPSGQGWIISLGADLYVPLLLLRLGAGRHQEPKVSLAAAALLRSC